MKATSGASSVKKFEALLADPAAPGSFSENELAGLPDPVRRYFRASIASRAPIARSARFATRGSIKLGSRWLAFRGHEVLSPHRGLVWAVRTAGVISGSDRYLMGQGSMDWKLFGLVRLVHADGPEISRSAAGRVGAEAVWVPSALLPRFGVAWIALDDRHIAFSYRLDDTDLDVRCTLDEEGRVRTIVLERWGDPDSTGKSGRFWPEATTGIEPVLSPLRPNSGFSRPSLWGSPWPDMPEI
jgi:Family of unknown function (DUF6544)